MRLRVQEDGPALSRHRKDPVFSETRGKERGGPLKEIQGGGCELNSGVKQIQG